MSFDAPQDQPQPFGSPTGPGMPPSSDERMWAMLCHLGGLCKYTPVPFGNVIAPLILWLIKKDELAFVDDQGKEALNFQISMSIYMLVSTILVFVLIGIVLLIALAVFDLVVIVLAAVKANQGIAYRYPLCIRFIN